MSRRNTLAIVSVALLVLSAMAPSVVAAEEPLDVEVNQGRLGDAAVLVTANGTAVENATVNVSTANANATYAGTGTYETDANGTVSLPAPDSPVTIEVTAEEGDRNASVSHTLLAPSLGVAVEQSSNGDATATVTYSITGDVAENATVNVSTVDANDTYVGTGSYTTDANGTVVLPAPDEPVQVTVEASVSGLSGQTTIELVNASRIDEDEGDAFGARVSAYVHELLGDREPGTGIGGTLADWVTANNPGNAPDHAGPKDDTGRPDHAGPSADGEDDDRGRPDHAGGNGGGPPAHAGGNGNGNGR